MNSNSNKSVAIVIAPQDFRDEEFKLPYQALNNNNIKTIIASTQITQAKGMLGYSVKTQCLIKDLQTDELMAIIVVGGMGSPTFLWNDEALLNLLKTMHLDKKLICAICLSTVCLANAGILSGISATVWPSEDAIKVLIDHGVKYEDKPLIHDHNFITANGPQSAQDFAELIVTQLTKVKV